MDEWTRFDKITHAKGVWLVDSKGNKLLDGVASMWCNVWGHSNPQLIKAITQQSKKLQHSSLFNLTNQPAEELGDMLLKIAPKMHKVFYSDNGSSAMEIAIKMALQYWQNKKEKKKTKIATLKNGYHGDTFGAMSIGYVPEFFGKFKKQLFPTVSFPTPNNPPKGYTINDYQGMILNKIEKRLEKGDVAAFVMESGAQVAGGVIIYPKTFQGMISKLCKKHNTLFILDEIATGLGRLGSMAQYVEQKSTPDIISFGKMLTGGYLSMAATITNKKIYDAFLGEFDEKRHLFHGHTYTGNPIAAAVACENLKMYKRYNLIKKIQKNSKLFEEYYDTIEQLDGVKSIRHKGMLMGIELKIRGNAEKSINYTMYQEGKKHGIYLRTLGGIVMLVPPLAINPQEITMLLDRAIKTIKSARV